MLLKDKVYAQRFATFGPAEISLALVVSAVNFLIEDSYISTLHIMECKCFCILVASLKFLLGTVICMPPSVCNKILQIVA